jgi:hypothetical protein
LKIGEVVMMRAADSSSMSWWELGRGEALRVGPAGDLGRIVAIGRCPGDDAWSTGGSRHRGASTSG